MQVSITDDETGRLKEFMVIIKWAANVDVAALLDFVAYATLSLCSYHNRNSGCSLPYEPMQSPFKMLGMMH